ncbi:hypothetical protein BJ165DRAFT_1422470 [Panaeolus papilionaceus]|nr:hypothetical protein BJ165DRAFT_1422470 [Panaeolus papilionaceus]
MLSRRQVYLLAALLSICLLYVFKSILHISDAAMAVSPNSSYTSVASQVVEAEPAPPEPIVLTLVLMGRPAAQEGLVAIKSALIHSSRPLELHFICSEDVVEMIESKIQLIKRPYYSLNVTFHVVPVDRVRERLERADIGTARWNWWLLTKLLMHEILFDVEKTIFVDTDMIFVVDPVQLWDGFDTLEDNALLALPTLGPKSHAGEICTCVMLLHLERMRTPEPNSLLIPSSLVPGHKDIFTDAFLAAEREGIANHLGGTDNVPFSRKDPPYGDQGIFYALWHYRRNLFTHLSLRWDITQCRSSYGLQLWGFLDKDGNPTHDDTSIAEEEHTQKQGYTDRVGTDLVVPGILHFNCLQDAGSNVWQWPENHNGALRTWAPMVTTAVRYKWVWLNRGNGTAPVSVNKKLGIRWLDEKIKDGDSGTHA